MSSRARRVTGAAKIQPFSWGRASVLSSDEGSASAPGAPDSQARANAIEREAFARGYEAGERAGVEAGGTRVDAVLRRVAQTVDELAGLRQTIVQNTERQLVQLALSIAKRVVRREVALDAELVVAMARVALDRLGESSATTIRLHPDDCACMRDKDRQEWSGRGVTLVPDAAVPRGGCRVESDFGMVDASVDAQLGELARALLGDEDHAFGLAPEPAHVDA